MTDNHHKMAFLVGAMKSGTTTLALALEKHPEICLARSSQEGMKDKEPGYFSRDERYNKGDDWYRAHYAHATPGATLLDASTCYTRCARYPHAAERMARHSPEARIIYVLRDPAERAYSHYMMDMRTRYTAGQEPVRIEDYITEEGCATAAQECIDASRYSKQLRHLENFFDKDRIACVSFVDLCEQTQTTIARVLGHIGISRGYSPEAKQKNESNTQVKKMIADKALREAKTRCSWRVARSLTPRNFRPYAVAGYKRLLSSIGYEHRQERRFRQCVSPYDASTRQLLEEIFTEQQGELDDILQSYAPCANHHAAV